MQSKSPDSLFYALLLIIFLLPIPLGANRPWAWSFFQIAIFILSLACAYTARDKRWFGISKYTSMLYLWLALIIWASIQIIPMPAVIISWFSSFAHEIQAQANVETYFFSLDVGQSAISFFKLLAYFCLFTCTLLLVDTEKRIKWLLTTIVAAGLFQALYGAAEILFGLQRSLVFGFEVSKAATGSFVYKNHYANFLMMCLAAGIGLMVTGLQKNRNSSPKDFLRALASGFLSNKALIRICLAIMVVALVMSRSRMGNTAFFFSMTLVGVLSLVLIKDRSKGLSLLVVSMFVIDLFIVSAWFGLDKVQERIAQTSLQQESRDEVVRDALPMVTDFAFIGSGAGSFYSVFPQYQDSEVHAFYDHAHNDFLQMLVEYGIPGFAIMSAMVLFALYKSFRAMRRRKNSIFKGSAFACAMVFIGMLVHMTVDFPLQAFANGAYFVVFLAIAMIINSLKLYRKRVAS